MAWLRELERTPGWDPGELGWVKRVGSMVGDRADNPSDVGVR
ncbi:hypothetical protein [Amycolatopsis magusensis]